jgi:hypothetical protein
MILHERNALENSDGRRSVIILQEVHERNALENYAHCKQVKS